MDEFERMLAAYSDMRDQEQSLLSQLERYSLEIARLSSALEPNSDPDDAYMRAIYAELSVTLPSLVRERYENVALFHASITANRKVHLGELMAQHREGMGKVIEELVAVKASRRELYAELARYDAPPALGLDRARARLVEVPTGQ